MSLATKVLWGSILIILAIAFLSAILEVGSLDRIIASNFGPILFSAIGLQIVISVINGFMKGYKDNE